MIPFYANQLSDIAGGRYENSFPGATYARTDPTSEFARHFLTEPIYGEPEGFGNGDQIGPTTGISPITGYKDLPFGVVPGKYLANLGVDQDLGYGLRPDGTLTNVYTRGTNPEDGSTPYILEDDLIKNYGFDPKTVDRRSNDAFELNGEKFANPHFDSYRGSKAPTGWDYAPGVIFNTIANWASGGWYGYVKGTSDLLADDKSRAERGRTAGGLAFGGVMDYYGGDTGGNMAGDWNGDIGDNPGNFETGTGTFNSGMDFGGPGVGWDQLMSAASLPTTYNSGMDFGGEGVGFDGRSSTSNGGGPNFLERGGWLDEQLKKYGIQKGGPISTLFNVGAGGYGLYQAREMRKAAEEAAKRSDPFGGERGFYQQRLRELASNPNGIFNLPGYKAGEEAVMRSKASQGYNNSGNMAVALQKYGGDAYNQEMLRLMQLSGSGITGNPGGLYLQGQQNSNELINKSLNNFGYAIGGR